MTFTYRVLIALAVAAALLRASPAAAYRGAFTLEGGPSSGISFVRPSEGTGASVAGTMGGATLGLRYALSNRIELHLRGFWDAPATFVHEPVVVNDRTGVFTQELGRWGAAVGARYILTGLIWRIPVGVEVGWAHTSLQNRELLERSASGAATSLSLRNASSDQFLLGPFLGLEWQATDHLSVSILPRLEVLLGQQSAVGVVVPLMVGWSWYGLFPSL